MLKCFHCERKEEKNCDKFICSRCVQIILKIIDSNPLLAAKARERLFNFKPELQDKELYDISKERFMVYAEAGN